MARLRSPFLAIPTLTAIAFAVFAFAPTGVRECGVGVASAKTGFDSAYTYDQTWTASLRLVRVDLGLKISEKDEHDGFILFEYTEKDRTSPASIELVRTDHGVRVNCQIAQFASYHEAALLTRLARKLKDDFGSPPEKPAPIVDAGSDVEDAGSDSAPSSP